MTWAYSFEYLCQFQIVCIVVSGTLYISFQSWIKITKPVTQSIQWPEGRFAHAAAHIAGSVFVMIGGYALENDVWLCDTIQWNKVHNYYSFFKHNASCIAVMHKNID